VLRRFKRVGDLYAVVLSKPRVGHAGAAKLKLALQIKLSKNPILH
jgi:hypothetical protein